MRDFIPADVGWMKRSAHVCVGLRLISDVDSLKSNIIFISQSNQALKMRRSVTTLILVWQMILSRIYYQVN